jgi:hypothetical protein
MTGGLMQLVGKGAQDVLITGNPSFTHFRSVYKRHSEFAMEHFRLYFKTTNLNLPTSGSLTLRAKVERYAQLLHDCYLSIELPDIYSPIVPVTPGEHDILPPDADAIGYEFQWIHNIGYNMINHVSVLINGSEIVRHTGEWMKLYANLKFDANKKALLEQLVGNVPELYDPANAFGRINQYPHAISTNTTIAAPSIRGRVLTIPLHFWFCETIGAALPLIALQHSEVEFVVDLKNVYQLFTVRDVRESIGSVANPSFGTRLACPITTDAFNMSHFLSPPTYRDPTIPVNPNLLFWKMNPFMECNYIFVSDAEMAHIATTDHSFVVTQIDIREAQKQHGPSNDLDLIMRNLCTRVVWVGQRSDRYLKNDYDNYTNWENPYEPPLSGTGSFVTPYFTSGDQQQSGITTRDILLESAIVIDGKERFGFKQTEFFNHIQNYRHQTGRTVTDLPGMYTYSFALDHDTGQPSGHINGSMFNKTILRNTYVEPPLNSVLGVTSDPSEVCVLKSTASSPNPTVVPADRIANYRPDQLVRLIRKTEASTLAYTYNVRAFVESYNFLRVMGGIANVVFSS